MKKAVRLTILMFIIILLCVVYSCTALAASERIQFGEFPQSKVTDSRIIEQLNKIRGDKKKIEYNDKKYYLSGDTWFLVEPIVWVVTEDNNGGTLLVSEKILYSMKFSSNWDDTTWETSLVRKYLNEIFINFVFSVEEQKFIYTTNVSCKSNAVSEQIRQQGNDTVDKIFCLSIDEVTQILDKDEFQTTGTAVSGYTSCYYLRNVNWPGGFYPFFKWFCVYYCNKDSISYMATTVKSGIRPAMRVNLSEIKEYNKKNEEAKSKDISSASIKLSSSSVKYTGKAITPSVTVKYGSSTLKKDIDYSVLYSNNTYVGTASVTITGKGRYNGTVKKTFKITSPGKITVKFDGNGGSVSVRSKKVNRGSKYNTLPNPKRKGYRFEGWYTSKTAGKKKTSSSYVETTKNQTLYARWKKITYTISYELDGGNNSKSNPSAYTIETPKIVLKTPSRTGYTFKGWYSDNKYKKRVKTISKGSTGNKILYAKWSANKYSIAFNGNGSTSGHMAQMNNISYGKEQPLKRNQFSKKGYVFSGWSTRKGGEIEYADEQKIKNLSTKAGHTIVLYACWKKVTDERNNVFGKFISQVDKEKHSYGAVYSDDYFISSTDTENPGLAMLSMVASASAYHRDYSKEFLKDCGFKNVQYYYSSPTLKSPTKENCDHVGYTFGTKYLKDKNITIVAVLVKGTSADAEWYSNFNMGKDVVHRGFKLATDEVYEKVNDSIDTLKKNGEIKGNIKIWVTGHSRGAAVANLLGVSFNSKYGISNVYTYTFATPRTINIRKIKKWVPNIFNYLNPGDFVTELVPSAWDFGRYGTDIDLDNSVKEFMEINFYNLTGKAYTGFGVEGKDSLVNAFVKYGKSQSNYDDEKFIYHDLATGLSYRISVKNYCYDVLATFLSENKADALKALAAYSVASPESIIVSGKMIMDGKINSKFRHAHSIDSYLTWLDAMY